MKKRIYCACIWLSCVIRYENNKYCLLYKHERRFRRLRNPEILHDSLWVDLLLSVTLRLWMVCWPAGLLACWSADCAETYEDLKLHKPDRQHAKSRVFMEREYQSSETERVNVKN